MGQRVIESPREGGGGLVSRKRLPADDGEMRQLLLDACAERAERMAAVEVDALELRADVSTQKVYEIVRVGQLYGAIGQLESESTGERPTAHRVAMAAKLDDSWRELTDDLLDVVRKAVRGRIRACDEDSWQVRSLRSLIPCKGSARGQGKRRGLEPVALLTARLGVSRGGGEGWT